MRIPAGALQGRMSSRVPVQLIHTRGLRGLGDCLTIPGYDPPMCRDNATGNVVHCDAPACSVPARTGYSNVPNQYGAACTPRQYTFLDPAPWPPDDPCTIANLALPCVPNDWPARSKNAARCPDGSPMPYCPSLCPGAPPPQFTGGYAGQLPPDATSLQVGQNYSIQPYPAITPITAPVPQPQPQPHPDTTAVRSTGAGDRPLPPRDTTAPGGDPLATVKNFLTDAAVGGIPNWLLIAGGLAAVLIVPAVLRRGR